MWDRPYHFHTPHPKQCRSKRNANPVVSQLGFKNKGEATIETYDLQRESMFLKCPNDCSLQGWMTNLPVNIFCMRWIVISFCGFQNAEQCPWARDRKYTPDDFCSNRWPGYESFRHVFLSSSFANKYGGFPSFISHAAPLGYQATFRLCSSMCCAKYSV